MAKLGRPPKKTGTGIEPIAPALWDRVRRNVSQGLLPAIHGSEVARLHHFGLITPTEAAAAFRVGEIYSRWDRCMGRARAPRSPSYELGFSGTAPESQKALDQRDADEIKRERDAREKWDILEEKFVKLNVSPADRRRIEELCVQNECIGPMELSDIRPILAGLAQEFRVVTAGKNAALKKQAREITNPKMPAAAIAAKPSQIDRESFVSVITAKVPNLSVDQIDGLFSLYAEKRKEKTTLRDRETYRSDMKDGLVRKRKP